MLEIFSYSFMIRAFVAAGVIGVVAPLIGTFLVAKRYALMADSLAHVSLAGVAIGLLLGVSPLITAVVATVFTALVIEQLRAQKRLSGEAGLAMFLSGGLAIAIVLMNIGQGLNANVMSYLFGSIITVTPTELWIIGGLGFVILASIGLLYQEFVAVAFDEEAALVSGVPVRRLNTILMVLTALTVSIAMRIVGVLLIGALMVIPVVTATQLRQSFRATIACAILFSTSAVICGLVGSYYFDIAPGGSIVVSALLLFFLTTFLKR